MREDAEGAVHTAVATLSDSAGLRDLLLGAAKRERDRYYTLHLDFAADDPGAAQHVAAALAEALGILRHDVQKYSAAVSVSGGWSEAEPVFCMADGPEGAFCAYLAGHPGWHAEGGVDGLRWGEGDGQGTRQ
jgi:hypothetical protein